MSGAASTLHNININFAAAARGRSGVTHPRGSGDLRQRRHGSRVRPLPRVALGGQPAELGGVRPLGGSHIGSSSVVLTQPPIDLHRKKDEVLCLATAAAPSYERDASKEQIS